MILRLLEQAQSTRRSRSGSQVSRLESKTFTALQFHKQTFKHIEVWIFSLRSSGAPSTRLSFLSSPCCSLPCKLMAFGTFAQNHAQLRRLERHRNHTETTATMRPVRSSEHYRRQGSSPSSLAAAAAGAAGRASPLFRNSSSFHPTRSHQNLARPQPMPRNPPPRGVRGGAFEEEVRDRAGGVVVSESHGGAGGMVGHGGAAPLGGNLVPDGGSSGSLRGSPVMMHSPSPLRAASPSFSPGSYMSHPPLASGMGGGGGRQCKSPYGFIPIPRHGDDQPPAQHRGGGGPPPPSHRFTPPLSSPLSYRKSICSPSMFSTISNDDTEDTASLTLDASISSRLGSPYPVGGYGSRTGTPLLGRSSPRPWTPTALGAGGGGRQAPFPDDDSTTLVRKTRIKTEMCMHYVNHRPCPFGATCTYAHGEEELQMTRLLDLERAGLVDLETYRTKPCLAWVMTGSWYVYTNHCS